MILEIGKRAPGRGQRHGLARAGPVGDVGGRRAREGVLYVPRYAAVAERAGMGEPFARGRRHRCRGARPGLELTDFWGVAQCRRRSNARSCHPRTWRPARLLGACWAYFDDIAARVSPDLLPGARSGAAAATRSSATCT